MTAMTDLTDAQERALLALAAYADRYGAEAWHKPRGAQEPTLEILRARGLAKLQVRPSVTVAVITAKGRELLASMGY